ncbi:MAG: cohesin domain-containing protein, partial [Bacteroidota bacterium]
MKIKKLFLSLCLLFAVHCIYAQSFTFPTYYLEPSDSIVRPGDTIEVKILVRDYVQVGGAQFALNWDPAMLNFISLNQDSIVCDSIACGPNVSLTDDGVLIYVYLASLIGGDNLPDGREILSVFFEVTGQPGIADVVFANLRALTSVQIVIFRNNQILSSESLDNFINTSVRIIGSGPCSLIECPMANPPDLSCNAPIPPPAQSFNLADSLPQDPLLPTVATECFPVTMESTDSIVEIDCQRTIFRTYRITDVVGDQDSCQQVFSINIDASPPQAVCRNIDLFLDQDGMALLSPLDLDGGSSDNCTPDSDLQFSIDRTSFSCADLNPDLNGVTTIAVQFSVTDTCGNTASCTADVRLIDSIAPVIVCNNDLTITLDPGECRTLFNPVVFATDNCDTDVDIVQLEGPMDGDLLEKDTTYTYSYQATDDSGNTDVCVFTLAIEAFPNPSPNLSCNDIVNVTLDTLCEATITPDIVLEGGPYGCLEDYIVELFYDQALTQPIPTNPMVTSADVGRTVYSKVTDPETGVSCWGLLVIEDKTAPVLDCPCLQGGTPVTSVSGSIDNDDPMFFRPNNIGNNPGNCTVSGTNAFYDTFDFTISQADMYTFSMPSLIGPDFFFALYEGGFDPTQPCNNLLATDDDSNGTEPEIMIQLTLVPGDYTLVTTTFFANDPDGAYTYGISSTNGGQVLTRSEDCIVSCFDAQNFPQPTATDACGAVSLTSEDEVIDGGNCGNTTILRTWTATDVAGNTAVCTQEFIVEPGTISDVIAPPNYDGIDQPALNCENRCGGAAEFADTRFCGPSDLYWNVIADGPFAGNPSPDDGKTWGCGQVKCFGTGRPGGAATCPNFNTTFEDTRINICTTGPSDGCYKILREWTAIDWCTGEVAFFNQNIKVEDNEGPVISDIIDATVTTDVWRCEADYILPEPWLMDNCNSAPLDFTVTATGGTIGTKSGRPA